MINRFQQWLMRLPFLRSLSASAACVDFIRAYITNRASSANSTVGVNAADGLDIARRRLSQYPVGCRLKRGCCFPRILGSSGILSASDECCKLYLGARVVPSLEGAGSNPYTASFAGGKSGLSYGAMQDDVANSNSAKATFQNILNSTTTITGFSSSDITTIVGYASTKGIDPTNLNPYINKIDSALAASKGLVDAQDNVQLNVLLTNVEGAMFVASLNSSGPGELSPSKLNLAWVAELADWSNRTKGGLLELPRTTIY